MRVSMPWLGVGLLIGVLGIAALIPLASYDVVADVDPTRAFAGPGLRHPLGTDHLGRDILWRMLLASRAFVGPGLLACLVCLGFGLPLGAAAGWFSGAVAAVIRYLFTVVQGLPRFILVLLALSIYGNRPSVLAIAAGLAYAPTLGEAIFERIEGLRSSEFIAAHRAHGVSETRLLLVHLLWGACRRLLARHLLALFAFLLILETTLSYLGFGVEQPHPSWGNMLAFDLDHDGSGWMPLVAPATAIWLVIAATVWVRQGLAEEEHGA
ncbi:MAG: ABC transporter permease [Deltaproteobacteria bacterium]|nr:MAG: ABC transporter permease [Deltaproteobacteria bacterium]